jgi:hypothetical protein
MSVEFTIEGLNAQQRVLADIIWSCRTAEAVKGFIRSLPTRAQRQEAESIVELMKMAVVEQCYDGLAELSEAKQVLVKYNTKRG